MQRKVMNNPPAEGYKDTCIQEACFFLPFFESGEWRHGEKSPWKQFPKQDVTPELVQSLGEYTAHRIQRSAEVMAFLQSIVADWKVTPKKDGVFMETSSMIGEDILPKLTEAGFTGEDYVLYTEYTRKWGMI